MAEAIENELLLKSLCDANAELHAELARLQLPDTPVQFLDPIMLQRMRSPVILESGHTFERRTIERWLVGNRTNPLTNQQLTSSRLVQNLALRDMIREFESKTGRQMPEPELDMPEPEVDMPQPDITPTDGQRTRIRPEDVEVPAMESFIARIQSLMELNSDSEEEEQEEVQALMTAAVDAEALDVAAAAVMREVRADILAEDAAEMAEEGLIVESLSNSRGRDNTPIPTIRGDGATAGYATSPSQRVFTMGGILSGTPHPSAQMGPLSPLHYHPLLATSP
mmetsp:Transcript_65363/g.108594  ORF Transcript_65363/g.108594 Transcript_65363/m.108594 type:complete len:281 (+) Transcript_65363:59-901(+)|eukprot:CAMPEP_0119306088 /NCGR_PEP_ID=MMETSP1333-20130426/6914_1 /TAXON_ID=418940 /ORGANISM="Scyphosphaera apsteinii, Strain RCC1455" /LENGTH=280 /DNA_ID=CAMNT_0007309307 /DNA_START=53 /DNA_END=895 /DNA_ORIENTATION=+